MSTNFLFGIIAALLVAIAGIGGVSAYKNPGTVDKIVSTASDTIQETVGQTVQAVTSMTGISARSTNGSDDESDEFGDDEEDGEQTASATASGGTQTSGSQSTTSATATFTLAQIAKHNTKADCYTAISGSVYNLTPFISQHPGGSDAIASICGMDGTNAFTNQHGSQGRPAAELATLKIGVLAK